ncbi:BTB_2 domain-containing protein [Pycnococcus provasolii]
MGSHQTSAARPEREAFRDTFSPEEVHIVLSPGTSSQRPSPREDDNGALARADDDVFASPGDSEVSEAIAETMAEFESAMKAFNEASQRLQDAARRCRKVVSVAATRASTIETDALLEANRRRDEVASELATYKNEIMEDVVRQRLDVEEAAARVVSERVTSTRSMERASAAARGKISLDVGGVKFTTSLTTLLAVPGSLFTTMLANGQDAVPMDEDGRVFIDRDGERFRTILAFMRECAEFPEEILDLKMESRVVKDLTPRQRDDILSDARYFGLVEAMFPFQEATDVGLELLRSYLEMYKRNVSTSMYDQKRAVRVQRNVLDKSEIMNAMKRALMFIKCLVLELGGSSLNERVQGKYCITRDTINHAPIWKQMQSRNEEGLSAPFYMYFAKDGRLWIGERDAALKGANYGYLFNNVCLPLTFRSPLNVNPRMWQANADGASDAEWSAETQSKEMQWIEVSDVTLACIHALDDNYNADVLAARRLTGHKMSPVPNASPSYSPRSHHHLNQGGGGDDD